MFKAFVETDRSVPLGRTGQIGETVMFHAVEVLEDDCEHV